MRDFSEKLPPTSLKSNRFFSGLSLRISDEESVSWEAKRTNEREVIHFLSHNDVRDQDGGVRVFVLRDGRRQERYSFPSPACQFLYGKPTKRGPQRFSRLNPLGPWQYELQSLAMRVNGILHINQTSRPPARRLWAPWRPRAGWCRRASTGCRQSWAGAARTRVKCRVK